MLQAISILGNDEWQLSCCEMIAIPDPSRQSIYFRGSMVAAARAFPVLSTVLPKI